MLFRKTGMKKRLDADGSQDSESKDIAGLANELAGKSLINDTTTGHSDSASTSCDASKSVEQSKLPATVCPNSKKCFSDRYPELKTKSMIDQNQDLLEEMIVDEFSLILFNSIDDYKASFFKLRFMRFIISHRELID